MNSWARSYFFLIWPMHTFYLMPAWALSASRPIEIPLSWLLVPKLEHDVGHDSSSLVKKKPGSPPEDG